MAFGVPIAELLWLAFAILSAGIVTGLLAGLFGIGGGAIIVPVLFEGSGSGITVPEVDMRRPR
jgi:uncharacterized membrane protein YfcA